MDFGDCIKGHEPFTACIPDALWNAWYAHALEAEGEYVSLGELFRDALIDLLRDIGKLPAPWV